MRAVVRRIVFAVVASTLIAGGEGVSWGLQGPQPGGISATKLSLPNRPGSVRGLSDAASVNIFSGQVAYNIPLDLPTGAANFGPALGLTYSGDLGNGPIGIGWTLGGISVRRTLRHGVPAYTSADELELVGIGDESRMIPAGDGVTYWISGQGRNIRVRRQEQRFEVKDQNGTTYLLGATVASREFDKDRISAWHVDSVTNLAGQQIFFAYDADQGQSYLASVAWGPNRKYRADLHYEGRPDVVVSYRTGYLVRTARLLKDVEISALADDGTRRIIRTYRLDYDRSAAASRLIGLQMHGQSSGASSGEALAPLAFTYARPELAGTTLLNGTDGWTLTQRGVTLLDVDGDGMSDLVRMELGNHQYRKNRGGVFSDAIAISGAADIELEGAQLVDLDGDTRPELVHIVDDTWRVRSLDHGSWQQAGTWAGSNGVPLHGTGVVLADLNGDGRTDVIRGSTGGLLVNLNTSTGLAPTLVQPPISASEAVVEPGNANVRFTDFNGDGLADVVYLTDAWMKIFLGRGDGTFVLWVRDFYPWGTAAFDVNDLQLADLDRDGLVDLVRFSAGHAFWYAGLPNGHISEAPRHLPRPETVDADAVVTIADVNGNGSQDVIWSSPRGLWALDLAGTATGGMLERIDNGMGKVTRFLYRASAQLAADADLQGAPWTQKPAASIPIPVRVEVDLGPGTPLRVVHYGVRDGFWDGKERRFGGFLSASESHFTSTGPADTQVIETRYHAGLGDERVLRGRPWFTERFRGTGELFDTQKVDWQAMVVSGMPHTPYARRAIKLQDEGYFSEGVSAPRRTQVTYDYDAFGRNITETHFGLVDLAGDEKRIERLFGDDDAAWVRERVYSEKVSGIDGALASWKETYFSTLSGPELPLGTIGQGFVRRIDGFLDTTGGRPTQSSFDYDACGNPSSVYENGVTRTVGYQDCLFPVTETIQPGGGKPALTWIMTWDSVLGVPLTLTDPNQDVTTASYDTLARPVAIAVNNGPAHVHFAYDWIRSDPRTTTWVFDGHPADLSEAWPGGPHWRQTISVANGAGEELLSSTPMRDGRSIISNWTERDDRGRVILAAEPFYSSVPVPSARVPTARVQTMRYDAQGRLREKIRPNGAITTTTYAAFKQTVSTPELADVVSELDGLLRMRHTERTVNGLVEAVAAQYDAADRLTQMSLQGGAAIHAFQYDTLGRLRDASDPDTGPRHMNYDDSNFLREHINGAGQHVFFDYDGAGRLTRRGETLLPSAAADYAYTYDADASPLDPACRLQSRLARVAEPAGQVHLCYDAFGHSNGIGRTISPPNVTPRTGAERIETSPSGLLLASTFDDQFAVGYRYDGAGRAYCVGKPPVDGSNRCTTLPAGQIGGGSDDFWVADEIDASGRVFREHYRNEISQTYDYDTLGLTQKIDLFQPGSGPAVDLFNVTITRNPFGVPIAVTDTDTRGLDHSATYVYDTAGRLTASTLGGAGSRYAFSYQYDGLQNMISRQVSGPKDIGVLTGIYHYAERGYGPRQLTSIVPGVGQ